MSMRVSESVPLAASVISASNGSPKRRESFLGRSILILLLGGGVGGAFYTYTVGMERAQRDIDRAISSVRKYGHESTGVPPVANPAGIKPRPLWDGLVRIRPDEARSIGLLVAPVRSQVEPIKLELPGHTAYDPNSLTKIRPRFDTLVEKVRAELGQKVKKGDPLVDLHSTDLAAAKNDFQTAYVQWQHDLTLRMLRENLFKTKAISEQLLVDTRNDENKSRLAVTTARQKLVVFGVPEDQIDPLIKNLHPADLPDKDEIHNVIDKAKMTRLSPVDGIVIIRDVVPGNLYDTNVVLMVIAPLDHLFVWVNVYEADQVKVAMGQHMEIRFPYLDRTILGTVQYVATEVSKDTHAIKIRASIPNVDGKLKADMLVRASLDIPPVSGQTVVPRLAVVVMNGHEYAFVRKPPTNSRDDEPFERRKLVVAEERYDHIVVASGLKAGEEVASYGSLILAQLYEEQQMVATGMPLQ
jgi:cobalt-zinc-cadmium efflux system membrane fusion protein